MVVVLVVVGAGVLVGEGGKWKVEDLETGNGK